VKVENDSYDGGKDKIRPNTWLGDTRAFCHLTNSDEGIFDIKAIKSPVKIGSGKSMTATKIGKKRMTVIQKESLTQNIVLKDFKYVPELWVNLFPIGKALQNNFNIGNKGIKISLVKGKAKIVFDWIMPTSKGFVVGIENAANRTQQLGRTCSRQGQTGQHQNLHGWLTHAGKDCTHKTAKHYDWEIFGKLEPCGHCAMAKSRQKNLNKKAETRSDMLGECLLIDISSVKVLSYGQSKCWLLTVDDCTDMNWSEFLARKVVTTLARIQNLKRNA
jgi:hypothetical protein